MSIDFDPPGVRHERHWTPSGSVILCAISQARTRSVLFRVHKSLLIEQSEVFESMFDIPQGDSKSTENAEYYDRAPLVRLPDTAEEVSGLLNALRDPLTLCEPSAMPDTPMRLRNALHLATKYLMTDLRSKLVRILEREWPSSLEELEIRNHAFDEFPKANMFKMSYEGWPRIFTPEPAASIALAEEFDIESILPWAYYDLTRCVASRCWDSCLSEEEGSFVETSTSRGKAARWECLSASALLRMLRIREFLNGERTKRFKSYVELTGAHYTVGHSSCEDSFCQLLSEAHSEATARSDSDPDILKLLRRLSMRISARPNKELCVCCRSVFLRGVYKRKDEVWREVERMSRL
ncbi:hypothetical protein SCHPADRAFT_848101 [Schizopora paradoxa]|uniref:BTB domain-containing protein n=1 Tax=Schizopora paradoxa TaxID=27342 RepID=A0A0H2S498_9AGAM|nr:hypothetical protein SCHPADRAFT_848101 [Schizopora paradoxa]